MDVLETYFEWVFDRYGAGRWRSLLRSDRTIRQLGEGDEEDEGKNVHIPMAKGLLINKMRSCGSSSLICGQGHGRPPRGPATGTRTCDGAQELRRLSGFSHIKRGTVANHFLTTASRSQMATASFWEDIFFVREKALSKALDGSKLFDEKERKKML